MKLPDLIPGKLIKRYKRFLADVELDNGDIVTAHCPNSGRMTTCVGSDWPVLLSLHDSPHRKLKYTLEMTNNGQTWIVVNTNRANDLAYEAICNGVIKSVNYPTILREKKYGKNSRIDILAQSPSETCYIEVKSVTLINTNGQYAFPDAPTERGRKHLKELSDMVKQGHRAILLFVIMREDGTDFTPAKDIDPEYSHLLAESIKSGVECYAFQAEISSEEIILKQEVKVIA